MKMPRTERDQEASPTGLKDKCWVVRCKKIGKVVGGKAGKEVG